MTKDVIAEVAQMGPPATIVGLTLWGVTLQDWVLIFSLILILLQIGWFIYDKIFRRLGASKPVAPEQVEPHDRPRRR